MNKIYYKELAHMILEAKKSQGVSSDPRAENQFQLTSGREQFLPFSVFFVVVVVWWCSIQALRGLDEAHPHSGEGGTCFTQSANSYANLIWKYPHRNGLPW